VVKVGDMSVRLQMVTPVGQFQDKVIRAMYMELTKKLHSAAFLSSLRSGAKRILEQSLRVQPTYLSMVTHDGQLRSELGVADSQSAMESLIRAWLRSIEVRVNRPRIVGHRIIGTVVTIRAIQADYQDVLDKAWASYTTERGQEIPWLDWLLTKGSEILVSNHMVYRSPFPTARSRTGTNTVMIKTRGHGWGVPEAYAGTYENNYATNAVVTAMPAVERLFETEVTRRFI